MNWLDIVLAGLALAGFIKGYRDGLLRQVVALVAVVAAIYLSSSVANALREYVVQAGIAESNATIIGYMLAILLIAGIVWLTGWIANKIISVTPLSFPNHLAGSIFGLAVTLLLLSLALNMLETVDRKSIVIPRETKMESRFYFPALELAQSLVPTTLFLGQYDEDSESVN